MSRLHLIHGRPKEGEKYCELLQDAGYQVVLEKEQGGAILRKLKSDQPDAVLIDLTRMPSHGRDVAVGLRLAMITRSLPLVFIGGDAAKVAKVERLLPDAVYTSWDRVLDRLDSAISNPPADPVVPASMLAGYSGTPLPKKLGIKEDMVLTLVSAPSDVIEILGELPQGVRVTRRVSGQCALIIFFVKRQARLRKELEHLRDAMATDGGLWVAWPKKASGVKSDLTQAEVRRLGLSIGLVDYKVCAIDDTWSGLKFARRRS